MLMRFLFRGWGRRAAWAMLILFLGLQLFWSSLFAAPRLELFDLYQRTFPRFRDSAPVVIVAIDDKSLAALGQWPWPRQLEAQLVTKILAGHPAALGVDLLWPEPDRESPEQWLKEAGDLPQALSGELRKLPSHDGLLRDALASGPVAIGIGGVRLSHRRDDGGPLAPVLIRGGDAASASRVLPVFDAALRSLPVLDSAAAGHGLLSVDPDPDGVFRRLPMLSLVAGRLAPSLSLEMLRLAAGAPAIELVMDSRGARGVAVGPLRIPTQAGGSVWIHFSPPDPRRFVSASDVLAGRIPADTFTQRLVLIGVTGLGQIDQRMTPLGMVMPGTEIHAQFLENVIEGRLARRPGWARWAEPAASFLLGLILILALPAFRPRWQGLVLLALLALLFAAGFLLWRQSLLLVDVATPAMAEGFVFLALLGGGFAEADTQRRRLRRELELRKHAAARAEGELEAGRRIQMGILPHPQDFADDARFDLGALMIPARQIGGDLYDFFKTDKDHLFFAVGDVSGKGVPAALFMALGKSLCKSCALRGDSDIGAIIDKTNAEIGRDNPEMLFITMFAGILNLATGELRFANAGHDAPFLIRKGGVPHPIETEGGPPLCVVEDFAYPSETIRLEPRDLLCLTTDGVTEAMTAEGALMGRERVEAVLAGLRPDASAAQVTHSLHAAVEDFVAGAEASDDLTILTVRWSGPA